MRRSLAILRAGSAILAFVPGIAPADPPRPADKPAPAANADGPVQPRKAGLFVDSLGVNFNPGRGDCRFEKDQDALRVLGIRHIRAVFQSDVDWTVAYARYNALAAEGIRATLSYHDGDAAGFVRRIKQHIPAAVEAVEGWNEPDGVRVGWDAGRIVANQRELHQAVHGDAVLGAKGRNLPIIGPSILTDGVARRAFDLGIAAFMDYSNAHVYPDWDRNDDRDGPRNPDPPEGSPALAYMLHRVAAAAAPGKETVITETSVAGGRRGLYRDGDWAGIYAPRLLLVEAQRSARPGVRTFYYHLYDFGDAWGGLVGADHATLRPEGRALKNLVAVLKDPAPGDFPAAPLNLRLVDSGAGALKSQLFQKRNGDYYLALWRAWPAADPPPAAEVTVAFTGFLPAAAVLYTRLEDPGFNPDGAPLKPSPRMTFTVGNRVQIVRLTGRR